MVSIPHPLRGLGTTEPREEAASHPRRWVAAGIILVGAAAMLPVLQKSTLTSRGFTLQEHQAEHARLLSEVGILETEVARLTSHERVERRAAQIGLFPSEGAMFVHVDVPGPEPAKVPAEFLSPREPVTDDPEPWWRSLLGWLRLPL